MAALASSPGRTDMCGRSVRPTPRRTSPSSSGDATSVTSVERAGAFPPFLLPHAYAVTGEGADGLGERAAGSGEDDELLGAGVDPCRQHSDGLGLLLSNPIGPSGALVQTRQGDRRTVGARLLPSFRSARHSTPSLPSL